MRAGPKRTFPPGPRGLPVLGSLLPMWRDPMQLLLDSSRRFGGVFQFKLGPKRFFFVSEPDGIQHILQEHHRNYAHWPRENKNYRALLGHGLLTSEGEIWRRHRSLAQPAFHRRQLGVLVGTLTGATAEASARWEHYAYSGQPMDVGAEMRWLTLTIVTRALYGLDASDQAEHVGQSLSKAMRHIARGLMLPFELPGLANRRFLEAVETLDRLVYGIIDSRQRDPQDRNDLLAMLMAARGEGGGGLNAQELRDEVMTFLLAGHETSALGLTWTWHLLAQHPEVARRLHAEAAQVLGGRAPTDVELAHLPYTLNVFQEALRLYPPAWIMARCALADDQIAGWTVPAGSVVLFSSYVTHRLPAYWPNPDVFDPERFADQRGAPQPRFAYFPFGGGPRQCIGNNFALREAQVILAMLAQRYCLEAMPGHTDEPRPALDMQPRRPILMRVVARRAA